jgi:pyoverdine/dityrosine biosynthesis protein Dit1
LFKVGGPSFLGAMSGRSPRSWPSTGLFCYSVFQYNYEDYMHGTCPYAIGVTNMMDHTETAILKRNKIIKVLDMQKRIEEMNVYIW